MLLQLAPPTPPATHPWVPHHSRHTSPDTPAHPHPPALTQVELTAVFPEVRLLPSAEVGAVPSGDRALLAPPTAFAKRKGLSATEPGHVILVEYLEQQVLGVLRLEGGGPLVPGGCGWWPMFRAGVWV